MSIEHEVKRLMYARENYDRVFAAAVSRGREDMIKLEAYRRLLKELTGDEHSERHAEICLEIQREQLAEEIQKGREQAYRELERWGDD